MPAEIRQEPWRAVVVDQDPEVAARVKATLEGACPDEAAEPLEVHVALTPCEGCRMVSEWRPAVLIVDDLSRCATGRDLLRRVREGDQDVGIVLTAARMDTDKAVDAAWRGACAVLARPFTDTQLVHAVDRALAFHRSRRHERDTRYAFALTLGHELKSPLDAVEMTLNNIVSGLLGPVSEQQVDRLLRATARLNAMRAMVTDFLDWARLSADRRARRLEVFPASEALRKVIDQAAEAAQAMGVAMLADAPEHILLRADRWEIETLLSNLVSNAIKYNRSGGRVIVRVREEADQIAMEVRDTGIGIDPAAQSRLFRPFSRLRDPKAEHVPGTGLGLAIAREIAQRYDGDIDVESTPGEGSCFTARLRRCRGVDIAWDADACPFD